MVQKGLFQETPLNDRGQYETPLLYVVEQLNNGELKIPHFQREPNAWKASKQKNWFDTVISGDAIGVIVTYQLKIPVSGSHHPIYLADGFQRLTATIEVMLNPRDYGYTFDDDQAKKYVKSFRIVQQHRIYESHEQAYMAFQNLNRGTSATPAEFYKGELTKTTDGAYMYDVLPVILQESSNHFTRNLEYQRTSIGKHQRVSLAAFYQYVTKSKVTRFWDSSKATINIDTDNPIERYLHRWIEDKPDIKQHIKSYKSFVQEQCALIFEILRQEKGQGETVSLAVYHTLLHFGIWRRNTGIVDIGYQEELTRKVFRHSRTNTSTLLVGDDVSTADKYVLSAGDLNRLLRFADAVGMPIAKKTRKKQPKARGYDNSHKIPFADFGDGETFGEPAPLNRARGRKPVDNDSIAS